MATLIRLPPPNAAIPFPDESVVQHDWVKARQYSPSSVDAAKAVNQKVRIERSSCQ
jgi:hypothetical protein